MQDIQTIPAYLSLEAVESPDMRIPVMNTDVEISIYRSGGGLVLQVYKQGVVVYKCLLRNVFDGLSPSLALTRFDDMLVRSIPAVTPFFEASNDA